MNRAQKIAWFNLKVVAISAPVSLLIILVSLLAEAVAVALVGAGTLAIAALVMGLSPVFFKKEPGRVGFDERDAIIEKKAHFIGYCALWCIFIAACTIPAFVASSISTAALPAVLAAALVTVRLVHSIAVLVQYGRGGEGETL